MELSQQGTSNNSNDHDPRLDFVRQKYNELSGQIESVQKQFSVGSTAKLSNVFQYIGSTYFYESLAQFGLNTKLNHFYTSLKIGDRFVAKVVNVFERSADVLLIWSPKKDIRDLKIKAYLLLVESKRYNNSNRLSKYSRQISDVMLNKSLDVSELVYVELVQFNESNRKIEVVRCKSLTDDESMDDEEDDSLLNEEKFISKSPSVISFHDYMMDHDDLRNPSLIKQPTFTSLLHSDQVIQSHKKKFEEIRNKTNEVPNAMPNALPAKKDEFEDEVFLLDDPKPDKQISQSGNNFRRNTFNPPNRSPRFHESSKNKYHHENISHESKYDSKRRTFSISSDLTSNSKNNSSRISKHSSISSSSSESEVDSSSSDNSDYSHKKRKHSKSQHDKKRHKKRSKKHSKKSKKKKAKKSKDRHRRSSSSDNYERKNSKKKKIDDKILKLLKFT